MRYHSLIVPAYGPVDPKPSRNRFTRNATLSFCAVDVIAASRPVVQEHSPGFGDVDNPARGNEQGVASDLHEIAVDDEDMAARERDLPAIPGSP
ncbi:hypothetical protein [Mycobacterium sp.]|uniref:hypothetical protein n=1 Tax=Mycobacterium sp. TaxID=1785 RepID=UPI003BAE4F36